MAADPAIPLDPAETERIYRTLIEPILFGSSPGGEPDPTLVLLGGQPGAGKSRTSARLLAEHDTMVAVTGDELRIFHPMYRQLTTSRPEQAPAILAEATREWVRTAIQSSLENRQSLLLEGTFGDPELTLATADRFRQAGFRVHVVALASPRVLSILTTASRYLRDRKVGTPARFTRLSAHDRGYDGTRHLIAALDTNASVDRITIISRNGTLLVDRERDDAWGAAVADAKAALHDGRHPASWGARSTMELLGELKQVTAYAVASGQLTSDTAKLLETAHELALVEVVPNLSIAGESSQARFIQHAVTEQLVELRRAASAAAVQTLHETSQAELAPTPSPRDRSL